MRDCLQSEPDERPSAKDLVNRLSGSASIARSISQRSTSWSNAGNTISGQTLADRCARAAACPLPRCAALFAPRSALLGRDGM